MVTKTFAAQPISHVFSRGTEALMKTHEKNQGVVCYFSRLDPISPFQSSFQFFFFSIGSARLS